MNPAQRLALFNKYGGNCAYCGQSLPEKGWHADHIEAIVRDFEWKKVENDPRGWSHRAVQTGTCAHPERMRIDNLNPSCRACNINKSSMSLEHWRGMLEQLIRVLRDNYAPFRHAERFGLVAVAETKVVFYFEKLLDEETNL